MTKKLINRRNQLMILLALINYFLIALRNPCLLCDMIELRVDCGIICCRMTKVPSDL